MSLDAALRETMGQLPGCVYSAYIDLDMGMMLAGSPSDRHSTDTADLIAAAVVNFFENSHVVQIEDMFRKGTGHENEMSPYFQEMLIVGKSSTFALLRLPDNPTHVACFQFEEIAKPEVLLGQIRKILGKLEGQI